MRRKMKTIFRLFFLITGILANSPYPHTSNCLNNNYCDNYQHEPSASTVNQRDGQKTNQVLVKSNSDFAFKLLRNTGKNNTFFSPLSISSAFAMLALGAKGRTLDQILKALEFRPSEIQERMIHESFHELIHMLNKRGAAYQLEMGNCLFVQNQLPLQQQFLHGVRKFYGGDVSLENFKNATETKQRINNYIERKTHGKIIKIINEVNPFTEILLINYIYLKAKWKKPFNPKYTKECDFYVNPHMVVKVPMMFQMGMFETGRDDKQFCTILKMPYEGHIDAYFILPDEGQLEKMVSNLSSEVLETWESLLSKSYVNAYIPKCLVTGELNLRDIMYSFGMTDVFTGKADLSGITGQTHYKLSEATHKAVMSIDERETEASAATSMDLVPMSAPTTIIFNRPFLYIVYDARTDCVLFMGKVTNP